jgi:hypothetical protein
MSGERSGPRVKSRHIIVKLVGDPNVGGHPPRGKGATSPTPNASLQHDTAYERCIEQQLSVSPTSGTVRDTWLNGVLQRLRATQTQAVPSATNNAVYTPTHVNPEPLTAPSSVVSATFADAELFRILLVLPVIDEPRIDGDEAPFHTP